MSLGGAARRPALAGWRSCLAALLLLLLPLPACTSHTVCNAAAARILAPAFAVAGDAVYAVFQTGSVSALRASAGAPLWRAAGGGGFGSPTAPVVAGDALLIAGGPGAIEARRLSDGAALWRTQPGSQGDLSDRPRTVPVVADGVVYAAADAGSIAAWRLADGAALWRSPSMSLEPDPMYGAGMLPVPTPVVAGGVVYFSAGRAVHALWAGDGAAVWTSSALQVGNIYTPPVLADGRLFIVAHDESVYALDAATGAILWHAPGPDAAALNIAPLPALPALPMVAGGAVYYAPIDGVRALAVATGKLLWSAPADNSAGQAASVQVAGGVAYAPFGGALAAFDARTGALRWKAAGQLAPGWMSLVAGGAVYTPSADGVTAWRVSDGAALWRYSLSRGGDVVGQVVVAGDAVYLSASGMTAPCGGNPDLPTLVALRAADGTPLWHAALAP